MQRGRCTFWLGLWLLLGVCLLCALLSLEMSGEQRTSLLSRTESWADHTQTKMVQGEALCRKQGWSQAKAAARVFDCFPMNSELDMLEVRLNELDDVVDYFVIVESKISHRNTSKPLYYKEAAQRYRKFASKIIYVELATLEGETTWDREHYQRNCLFTHGLHSKGREARSGDIVIMADLDEMPKPAWVAALKLCTGYGPQVTLEAHWSLYSFDNEVQNVIWQKVKAIVHNETDESDAETLRFRTDLPAFSDAAWHCSWCFLNMSTFEEKLHSFAHEEVDQPSVNSQHIAKCVRQGLDLFHRDDVIISQSREPDVPQFVNDNLDQFGYMRSRDGRFGDFPDFANFPLS